MAAVTGLLSTGDHIVAMDDLYGGSNRYFRKVASKLGIETTFVDATDPNNIENAVRSNTKMVWIETPTNPTLKLVDVHAVVEIAHKHKDVFVVVDNTFESAYFQRPLELGTKYVITDKPKCDASCIPKYFNPNLSIRCRHCVLFFDEVHEWTHRCHYGLSRT